MNFFLFLSEQPTVLNINSVLTLSISWMNVHVGNLETRRPNRAEE
jgi:hypothetical protein